MKYKIGAESGIMFSSSKIETTTFGIRARSKHFFSIYYIDRANAESIKEYGKFSNILDIRYIKEDVKKVCDTISTYDHQGYFFINNKNKTEIQVDLKLSTKNKNTIESYVGFTGFGIRLY
jgi:hypothetical protein